MRLERKMIIDVEGGTVPECMRILRHEAGHVIQHSYRLNRRRRWQQLFGRSSTRYPDFYRPNPASKNYVQHLRLWYAQSHPDEDFAETFAVWLRPRSDWRKRYEGWPVFKKLEYVDELMEEIAGERPTLTHRHRIDPLSTLTETLAEHYKQKQALYAMPTTTIYDRDLRRIFSDEPRHYRAPAASTFLRTSRPHPAHGGEVDRRISADVGFSARRDDRPLPRAEAARRRQPAQLVVNFTVLLTAKTVHSLYSPSRREWFAL
jgi:hypothetical protein